MRKLIVPALLISIAGCGGSRPTTVQNPSFGVNWPGLTRSVSAPASAMSGRAVFRHAGAPDLTVNFNRSNDSTPHLESYNIGRDIFEDTKDFEVTFFTGADQTGDIVAAGAGEVSWKNSTLVGSIALDSKIASVSIPAPGTIYVDDPTTTLLFFAKDAAGHDLAIPVGAAHWGATTGADCATVSEDGTIGAIKAGTVNVRVTVDGVASGDTPVTVALPPIQVTAIPAVAPMAFARVGYFGESFINNEFGGDVFPGYYGPNGFQPFASAYTRVARTLDGTLAGGEGRELKVWSDETMTNGVSLLPTGASGGVVYEADAQTQVGSVDLAAENHAFMWHGTAGSGIDLTPSGVSRCAAEGFAANIQAGWVTYGGPIHAAIWHDTANSFVDVHPSSWTLSRIIATSTEVQAGFVYGNFVQHAACWTGTAGSFRDLTPSSSSSFAQCAAGKYVGGYDGNSPTIWNGLTGASINLAPVIGNGEIKCMRQVGNGNIEVIGAAGLNGFRALVPRSQLP